MAIQTCRLGDYEPSRSSPSEWWLPLEARSLFSSAPLPLLADLDSPSNPVIRLSTALGDIDIELFADRMPELVSQFIAGSDRGTTSDFTFFHRSQPGVFLQGGTFTFAGNTDGGAEPALSLLADQISSGAGLANIERTVATGTLLDSLNSPFIFNLADNSARFDPDELIVFGRIVDDRSWEVVQAISSLPVADLAGDASFAGLFADSFTSVPVTRPYDPGSDGEDPQPVTPDLLVQNSDLSVLKGIGAPDFYRHRLFQPEGYRHEGTREFVPIENLNDQPVWFELMARYEQVPGGTLEMSRRDDLIASGMIPARSRGGVTIQIGNWLVPSAIELTDRPFAMELRTTLPVVASLSHYLTFFGGIALPFTDATATTSYFPEVVSGSQGADDYLVWYNPGSDAAVVTVTITSDQGVEMDPIVFDLAPYRRGGIALRGLPGAPTTGFARVDSSQPIAVARSHYAIVVSGGFAHYGFAEPASAVGAVALAADAFGIGTPGPIRFVAINLGTDEVRVSLALYAPGSNTPVLSFPDAITIAPGHRAVFEQPTASIVGPLSLVYHATGPVYAIYSTRTPIELGGAVLARAATSVHFAEGFIDPSRDMLTFPVHESIHVFNPFGAPLGLGVSNASVRITFRYADGFELALDQIVAGGSMESIVVSARPEILAQATQNQRYYYSIEVSSDVPIVAQMFHFDVMQLDFEGIPDSFFRGGGFILDGSIFGPAVRLDELEPG